MERQEATRVADGGLCRALELTNQLPKTRPTQDDAVEVFSGRFPSGVEERQPSSAAQGEQGGAPSAEGIRGSGAGAQATCAGQSTGNAQVLVVLGILQIRRRTFLYQKTHFFGKAFVSTTTKAQLTCFEQLMRGDRLTAQHWAVRAITGCEGSLLT